MNYLKQVQRGIDYVEANLDNDIALAAVAKHANISQWHFQRIFKALTNETLKTYIRSRRLAKALERLLHTDARIIDIGMQAGYDTHEGFTRAFKKAFRMTPEQYRSVGVEHRFLKKLEFDDKYLRHINQNVSLAPTLVTHPQRHFVGIETRFYSVDSQKNNIAERLPPLWQAFLARLPEFAMPDLDTCYGIVRPTPQNTELLEYIAAVKVSNNYSVPQNMSHVQLPPATYATFAHCGAVADLNHTVSYIYSTWLTQSGREHTYGPDLEIYGPGYHATSPDSVIHYAIPVH